MNSDECKIEVSQASMMPTPSHGPRDFGLYARASSSNLVVEQQYSCVHSVITHDWLLTYIVASRLALSGLPVATTSTATSSSRKRRAQASLWKYFISRRNSFCYSATYVTMGNKTQEGQIFMQKFKLIPARGRNLERKSAFFSA